MIHQFSAWLWRLPVAARRALLFTTAGLLLASVVLGCSGGLFQGPADGLTSALSALFLILATFAAIAWVLRVFGFLVSAAPPEEDSGPTGTPTSRTAFVMPIYHEDVARVALGVERTWLSAKGSGLADVCDFFVLSDSTDDRVRAEEERACAGLLVHFDGNQGHSGRLFLVRRTERGGFKAGNIAHFLHLHGADYEFMLVLDADSVMTGERIRRLICKLERRPRTALIQSLMTLFRARTLFARVMQSSQNPQSALYSSGLRWLLGSEGIYWGHNALIRIRPFAEHAMLPLYPGSPPQGGPVLSQDVHEASLLGRAGWAVELDLEEGGSFEEMPANVLSNAERDRRWCQGDFLNLALVVCDGIRAGQKLWLFYIFTGYFLSLPVVGIMLLGSLDACRSAAGGGVGAGWLVLSNIYLLQLVPKGLALLRSLGRHGSIRYGIGSFLLDTAGSLVFGPLMLYLHGRIIVCLLAGRARPWTSPSRNPDDPLSWGQATEAFWPATAVGTVWIAVLASKAPLHLTLCGPIMAVWVLSIPTAVLTSRVGFADRLARKGWMRAPLSSDEALALGSLVLEADRVHPCRQELRSVPEASPEALRRLTPPLSKTSIRLGGTTLRLFPSGTASTEPRKVEKGFIGPQRLLLLLGLVTVALLAIGRYVFWR